MKKIIKFSYLLAVLLFASTNTFSQCYTCSSNTPDSTLKASAFNYNSIATGLYSFTAGNNTISSGESSTSFGSNTTASGLCSFALGYNSTSGGNYGIAVGHSANAYGVAAVSIGFGSQAFNHSFAIGEKSLATGESSMALGHYVTAGVVGAMVIGNSTDDNVLVNNTSHSLMIGFQSKLPALFVGSPYPNSGELEGRVGIATSNPLYKLHVEGNGYFQKDLMIGNSDHNAKLIVSSLKASNGNQFVIADGNGELSLMPDAIMSYQSNKVGIGCDPIETSKYRLFVKSGIETEEVLIKLQGEWSDYVFDSKYKLRTLSEVEKYITLNKHLPDIPSASQVRENGIQVGEMNALLLQKIEELTLYIIEQQKQIDLLKEQINN
jgi:hypothetical protein